MPIYFFKAENDFHLAPSRVLADQAKAPGRDVVRRIYPPFGTSHRDGHSFACRGGNVWFDDVLTFLNAHCGAASTR